MAPLVLCNNLSFQLYTLRLDVIMIIYNLYANFDYMSVT